MIKVILLLLFTSNLHASWIVDQRCADSKVSDLVNCINPNAIEEAVPFTPRFKDFEPILRKKWLEDKLNNQFNLVEAEIENEKWIQRYLRTGKVKDGDNESWYLHKIYKMKKDFNALKEVQTRLNTAIIQRNTPPHTPAWRIELEEQIRYLQALKVQLLVANPILASPDFEELIKKDGYSDSQFKKALLSAYSDYLGGLLDRKLEIKRLITRENMRKRFLSHPTRNLQKSHKDKYISDINEWMDIDNFLSRFLSEQNWIEETTPFSPDKDIACYFYNKNKQYTEDAAFRNFMLDATLTVAPIALGPAFRLGVWGLRYANLLKWGVRDNLVRNVTQIMSATGTALLIGKDIDTINMKRKECEDRLTQFQLTNNKSHFEAYNKCNDSLSNQMIMATINVGLNTVPVLTNTLEAIQFYKSYNFVDEIYNVRSMERLDDLIATKHVSSSNYSEAGFKFSDSQSDFYILNLKSTHGEMNKMSNRYWEFVGQTYNERLRLSPEEIRGFIESSKQMSPRTTVLINTPKGRTDQFRGGVAVVMSKNSSEKLPFEKATGINVDREPGKRSIEIVRLTVNNKETGHRLSEQLISSVIKIINAESDISKVYVYTSKSHHRLYQRMLRKQGMQSKIVHNHEEDVIIEISSK